ncbi:MAG TPA: tRNA 5-methoxyuridine(34)/uridine 5-oxyacetic acid(34) synthase CmoB [Campylobacterales bacterium]|nr:tRNA 5-methoxyuridine(34)/uridine 5-oxyacetic acid(34) synthase CmoB [Campylobacterales bacterium]HIP40950.1 tRNA 5-methoxyuridine(34)/uridine 5-oxyacetic acid(34) synthase CmoB [Campylobacterales bacterium]
MNLDLLRQEREKCIEWKNIKPYWKAVTGLPTVQDIEVKFGDTIEISSNSFSKEDEAYIYSAAKTVWPWRKGPFQISKTFIDSEWKSNIKYDLLRPHFNLKDKIVGDIGCNNGYYLFRMMEDKPKRLVGFDPSAIPYCQFKFLDHFIDSGIKYELLGVEHVEHYEHKFDTLFCLGVIYHRADPIGSLKSLYKGLNYGGELILDTFMIDGEEELCLTPKKRYSKIPNIYFIPTVNALKNWCYRAGFETVEVLDIVKTKRDEQRRTEWINTQSLDDFLDENDESRTVEGYPAPKRVYIKAKKIKK